MTDRVTAATRERRRDALERRVRGEGRFVERPRALPHPEQEPVTRSAAPGGKALALPSATPVRCRAARCPDGPIIRVDPRSEAPRVDPPAAP